MALGGLAFGVEPEQLIRHVLHRLAYTSLGFAPGSSAQMVEYGLGPLRRAVLLHQIEPSQRHIQTRAFGILEQHEFRIAVALVDILQSLVLSDAVLDVDHIVANLQVAKIGKKSGSLGLVPLRTSDD